MNISFKGIQGTATRMDGTQFKFDENQMSVLKESKNQYSLAKNLPSGKIASLEKGFPTYKQVKITGVNGGSVRFNVNENLSIPHVENADIQLAQGTKLKINDIGKKVKIFLEEGTKFESPKKLTDTQLNIGGIDCKVTGNHLSIEA